MRENRYLIKFLTESNVKHSIQSAGDWVPLETDSEFSIQRIYWGMPLGLISVEGKGRTEADLGRSWL
jgi:hypothetical protein